eukprot:jgi/Tetstr1/455213/TSEL_042062.t1
MMMDALPLSAAQAATLGQVALSTFLFLLLDWVLSRRPLRAAIVAACTRPGEKLGEAERRTVFQQASSRLLGEVFNMLALPLALMVLADPEMWADRLHASTHTSQSLLLVCSGYFIHDSVICIRHVQHEGGMYLLHALCCMSIYTYGAFSGLQHLYGAAFILYEASTPFVHAHWYLLRLGRSGSKLFIANGLAMLAVFFCVRNVFGNAMSVDYFLATSAVLAAPGSSRLPAATIWGYRAANVTLNLLNLIWVTKIAAGAAKALRKAGKRA